MVLFVCYSEGLGGAERQLVDFASGLASVACVACPEGRLAETARRAGLRVFALRSRSLHMRLTVRDRLLSAPRIAGHARELRELFRNLDPELVVAWGMRPLLACVAVRIGGRGGTTVVFQHNDMLPGPMIGRLVRIAAAQTDLVIAASEAVARDLDPRRRLGDRLQVVHPGVDVDSFDRATPPAAPPEVLVLGALVDWKRPDLAVEAFALVRQQRPDARLRLIGAPLGRDDSLGDRLRERAARPDLAGAVELVGAVADPRAALERATCLLHCADREPFGLAVLEALAAGRPAVVPATAGPAEIVDRSSGLLFAPGDAQGAAHRILELLADPERAARMGASGRRRAQAHFARAHADRRFSTTLEPLLRPAEARPVAAGELAIVTVTHNSASELQALLRSVDRHLPGARLIVVDNASHDESVAVARAWHGTALVLAQADNLGFGRACNLALAHVDQPVTALLNPDVELLDGSLLALARELDSREPPERLMAPSVLRPDGSRQDSVHPAPTSLADLTRALVPAAALPGASALQLAPWRSSCPRRVGWAVGCALVARSDTFRRLGPFDERIFLYAEDLDLGLRAAAAGVQTWFWPHARVLHTGAHATHAVFGGEPFELLARARRDVVRRRLGPRRARLDGLAQAATFTSRASLKRLAGRPAARERHQLAALGNAARRRRKEKA